MRSALQRLLSRPSSLELLQYLTGQPILHHNGHPRFWNTTVAKRRYADVTILAKKSAHQQRADDFTTTNDASSQLTTQPESNDYGQENSSRRKNASSKRHPYGPWASDKRLQSVFQLDLESNLTLMTDTPKLLDPSRYGHDMRLWALLLDHRYRKFGAAGVRMFWEEIRSRNVELPTTVRSSSPGNMWQTILLLGFEDSSVLEQICKYADDLYNARGIRWPKLYRRVVQHFLVHGTGKQAIRWHERLINKHPPGPRELDTMLRSVLLLRENTAVESYLQQIYVACGHRKAYSKVIGVLCEQEKFDAAFKWHIFFMRHGDFPNSRVRVDRLLQYLVAYNMPKAIELIKSTVDAGVPFSSSLAKNLKISREMMNLIHGEHFHIKPKSYNDVLGARWFATRWVSLDVAISSIHALGVQEIGPFSLQAIALREPDPKDLANRIIQLHDLGISLGHSLYSRAVDKFSRNRDYANLESLLQSDQHPDELENPELQEYLLSSYAQKNDWKQYRRTLEIQKLRGTSPESATENLILRYHAKRQDPEALQQTLELMRQKGTHVSGTSMFKIVQSFLRPRQPSKRPTSTDTSDIDFVVFILKRIAYSGSHIPPTIWREILRRLGMLGRLSELENLCLFLASWYNPGSSSTSIAKKGIQHKLLTQLALSHPLHPLRIIFPVSFQRAAVEWGFIHALNGKSLDVVNHNISRSELDVTFGLRLLRKLFTQGVYIDMKAVGKCIAHRFTVYYGPGVSARKYNRRGRINLRLRHGRSEFSYEEIVSQVRGVLGAVMFSKLGIPQLVPLRSGRVLKASRARKAALARVASRSLIVF
jgi:hypothetical protein